MFTMSISGTPNCPQMKKPMATATATGTGKRRRAARGSEHRPRPTAHTQGSAGSEKMPVRRQRSEVASEPSASRIAMPASVRSPSRSGRGLVQLLVVTPPG